VVRTAPGDDTLALEMATRYMPSEKAAEFVEYERTQLGDHMAIYMQPEHWLSADLGPS
jgi:hypothetical protein